MTGSNKDSIYEALGYMTMKHHGQVRSGGKEPYAAHPLRVARRVVRWWEDRDYPVEVAALLHDVVEDCFPATAAGVRSGLTEIRTMFGETAALIVDELTLPPEVRKDYEAKTAHQMRMISETNYTGHRLIKIADKLDNISDLANATWTRNAKKAYLSDAKKVVEAASCPNPLVEHAIAVFMHLHRDIKAAL